MLKSFNNIFSNKATWNGPHHLDFLEPFKVKFHYKDRKISYLGLITIDYPADNLIESAKLWNDWQEVQIMAQVNLEQPHSYGFKNKKTGSHIFIYLHELMGKSVADIYYVDNKYKAVIKRFIEFGCIYIKLY